MKPRDATVLRILIATLDNPRLRNDDRNDREKIIRLAAYSGKKYGITKADIEALLEQRVTSIMFPKRDET